LSSYTIPTFYPMEKLSNYEGLEPSEDVFANQNLTQVSPKLECPSRSTNEGEIVHGNTGRTSMRRGHRLSSVQVRKQKQINQRELNDRLRADREKVRLENLAKWGEKELKNSKTSQKKKNLILSSVNSTIKRDLTSFTPRALPETFSDRRIYGADSFRDDGLIECVKIMPKDIEDDSEFRIISHPMQAIELDASRLLYGKTLRSLPVIVEKKEVVFNKTASKKNKVFLSKANFSYDLQGNKIPKNFNKMDIDNVSNDVVIADLHVREPYTNSFFKAVSDDEDDNIATVTKSNSRKTKLQRSDFLKDAELVTSPTKQLKRERSRKNKSKVCKVEEIDIPEVKLEVNQIDKNKTNMDSVKDEVPVVEPVVQLTPTTSEVKLEVNQIDENKINMDSVKNEVPVVEPVVQLTPATPETTVVDAIQQLTAQIAAMQAQINVLIAENAKKDEIIEKLRNPPKEVMVEQPKVNQQIPVETEKPKTKNQVIRPKLVRAKTDLVTRFSDDGIKADINMGQATTSKAQVKVAKTVLSLSKEELSKVTNAGIRDVSARKVEESFCDALQKGLVRSKSLISFKPSVNVQVYPKPKGITNKAWAIICFNVPETKENFQKIREQKVFDQYKKLFYANSTILNGRWKAAAADIKNQKLVNPWLSINVTIIANLKKADLSTVFEKISEWRLRASTYVEGGIRADWSKASPKTE